MHASRILSKHRVAAPAPTPAVVHLTDKEQQVLKWSALGKSSSEIAIITGCAESTVNFHFSNIRKKFNVHSRFCAILQAVNRRLITLD